MKRFAALALLLVIGTCALAFSGCAGQAHAMDAALYKSETVTKSMQRRERSSFVADSGGSVETAIPSPIRDSAQISPPDIDTTRSDRLVIYNAVVHVVVDRINDSIEHIRKTVIQMGGYMQNMSGDSITLKIPADRFNAAIAEVENLGEVTKKDIRGTDVTDEMRDLNIRLTNAEKFRQRLVDLLQKADKVEDALKIEKELERITQTIELLKGKIAQLSNSVAFSTLTVKFNSPVPQRKITTRTPFRWVHNLGTGLTKGTTQELREATSTWSKPMFDLPDGFIRHYEDPHRTAAMSADGVTIDMRKQKNYKGGSVEFWGDLIRTVLVEQKAFSIKEKSTLDLRGNAKAVVMSGSKQIGSKQYGYLITVAVNKRYVYVLEAWGPQKQFDIHLKELTEAVESIRLR